MLDLKYGYGCRIKATLLDQFGEPLFLQRCRGIVARVVNPDGLVRNVPKENIKYNEFRNVVQISVAPRAFATEGEYKIVVEVLPVSGPMVATRLTPFLTVSTGAAKGTAEIDMDMTLESVFLPACANTRGASPTVSKDGTWLVWNDEVGGYQDTGITVGYVQLLARYDAKYAEILQPAVQAADAANEAAAACKTATEAANSAAKECAETNEAAQKLITQMQGLIDDATEIVFVDSIYALPAQGSETKVYVDTSTNIIYRYSAADVCYYKIGVGYNDGDEIKFDGNGPTDGTTLNVINLTAVKSNK